jgi:hypothetical protein
LANAAETGSGGTIDQLRHRLNDGAPPKKKERQSVASDVRALLPEVRMKRAAGWTWEQIAAVMYDDEAKASAVRTAYNRLLRSKGQSKRRKPSGSAGHSCGQSHIPVPGVDARPAGTSAVSGGLPLPLPAIPGASAGAGESVTRPATPNLFGRLSDPGFRPTHGA